MTFAELRELTLTWLDDVNAGYFSNSQVNRWLNNAQIEVQKLLLQAGENYYMKPVQTTLVVNQQDYVLPQDFMHLHRLTLVVSGSPPTQSEVPLSPITTNQQDLVPNQTGQPQYYYIKRNRLVLFPTPDTTLPMILTYSPLVGDMTLDTDLPNVPPQYHEFLAVLATNDGLIKDGRQIDSIVMKKKYYEEMLKADSIERRQDAPRSVVMTGEGAGYTFGYW